jgi:hypothetical protein
MAVLLAPSFAMAKDDDGHRARKRGVVKKAEQLEDAKAVRKQRKPYKLLATAAFIHQECGQELGITASQKQFVEERFKQASKTYIDALDQTFVDRMKGLSTKVLKQDYVRYLQDVQKPAINNTASVIKQKGCKDRSLAAIIDYFDAIQKAEENAKKAIAAANGPVPEAPDVLNEAPPSAAIPAPQAAAPAPAAVAPTSPKNP